MYHVHLGRPVAAGLVATIVLAGSLLLGPASPAGATDASTETRGAARIDDRSAARARPFNVSGTGVGQASVGSDGVITFVAAGTQRATRLGRSTWHTEGECTTPTCSSLVARTTNVAANGDRLFFLETNNEGQLSVAITGGTGRFAGATGDLAVRSSVTVFDGTNPLAFTNTFDYVGTITVTTGRR